MVTDYQSIMDGLTEEEKEEALKILGELSQDGKSDTLQKIYEADYEEIPVDIDTFIDSPEYAGWFTGDGKNIYPYWRQKLREIFSDKENYTEIAISGGIGTGKSHIAVLALAYFLYRLMCLKDPYSQFNIAKGSYIYIVFFNATLQLSQGVAYTKFQSLLINSPWFQQRGTVGGTKYLEYIPNKPIRFTVGSQMEHSIGKDIIAGILDEVNFVKGADVNLEKSKIMKLYASVLERINSRFIVRGKVMGKLFLVSSKRAESDFIENYIKKQQGKPGIYTIDAKIWETKPKGTYSGKWFKVAIGGIYKPSKIIGEDESVEDYIMQDYQIMDIPVEFKKSFEMDMNTALMNVAGISISNTTRFIGYANLSKCYKDHKNPFTTNIITTGLYDKLTIKDFFIPDMVKPEIYGRPVFIHIDTSLTGDRTGISAVAVMGYKNVNEYSIESGDIETTKELYYHHIFSIGIQCPSNSEISFQKTRDFIYYLKYNLGWYIFGISCDGFQSRDTIQQLITAGFTNSKVVSLDKTPDGYLVYKNAINEQRISHIHIPELENEVINLARDNQTGKVDHDAEHSKDISDSLAGAVYNASQQEQELNLYMIDSHEIMLEANEWTDEDTTTQDLLSKMVANKIEEVPKDIPVPFRDSTDNEDNGFFFL